MLTYFFGVSIYALEYKLQTLGTLSVLFTAVSLTLRIGFSRVDTNVSVEWTSPVIQIKYPWCYLPLCTPCIMTNDLTWAVTCLLVYRAYQPPIYSITIPRQEPWLSVIQLRFTRTLTKYLIRNTCLSLFSTLLLCPPDGCLVSSWNPIAVWNSSLLIHW